MVAREAGCEDGAVWSDLRAERVARELAGLAARELVTAELLCTVDGLVDQVVPADASCWSTFDPATTMLTSAVGRNLDEDGGDAVPLHGARVREPGAGALSRADVQRGPADRARRRTAGRRPSSMPTSVSTWRRWGSVRSCGSCCATSARVGAARG